MAFVKTDNMFAYLCTAGRAHGENILSGIPASQSFMLPEKKNMTPLHFWEGGHITISSPDGPALQADINQVAHGSLKGQQHA